MKKIKLTQGQFALVDDEDYDRIIAMGKWKYQKSSTGSGYASKSKTKIKADGQTTYDTILMHRFIMNAVPLESWSLLRREGGDCRVYNYRNSKKIFDDFKFTGLNNFDFLAVDFVGEAGEANASD